VALERNDPYLNLRFQVEIEGVIVGGFSEVAGLGVEIETEVVREGGENIFSHFLPRGTRYPTLVLKRGITDSELLWGWCDEIVHGQITRRRASILLLDDEGQEKWRWNVRNALPVRWSGPGLHAVGHAVAFESLELSHEGIQKG
jgi:phage tail-like protein